jgi:Flp pilus assembly protein TadD
MAFSYTRNVSPEVARQVLKGEKPLSTLLGVSEADVLQLANFGHDLWRQGRYEDAAKVFQGIVALDENIYYGHAGLGLASMKMERYEAAETHLAKAHALAPHDSSVAVNLAEALLHLGKLPEAIAAMQRAIEAGGGADPGALRAKAILVGLGHGLAELTGSKSTPSS